jgi:hypothetical protein
MGYRAVFRMRTPEGHTLSVTDELHTVSSDEHSELRGDHRGQDQVVGSAPMSPLGILRENVVLFLH